MKINKNDSNRIKNARQKEDSNFKKKGTNV